MSESNTVGAFILQPNSNQRFFKNDYEQSGQEAPLTGFYIDPVESYKNALESGSIPDLVFSEKFAYGQGSNNVPVRFSGDVPKTPGHGGYMGEGDDEDKGIDEFTPNVSMNVCMRAIAALNHDGLTCAVLPTTSMTSLEKRRSRRVDTPEEIKAKFPPLEPKDVLLDFGELKLRRAHPYVAVHLYSVSQVKLELPDRSYTLDPDAVWVALHLPRDCTYGGTWRNPRRALLDEGNGLRILATERFFKMWEDNPEQAWPMLKEAITDAYYFPDDDGDYYAEDFQEDFFVEELESWFFGKLDSFAVHEIRSEIRETIVKVTSYLLGETQPDETFHRESIVSLGVNYQESPCGRDNLRVQASVQSIKGKKYRLRYESPPELSWDAARWEIEEVTS